MRPPMTDIMTYNRLQLCIDYSGCLFCKMAKRNLFIYFQIYLFVLINVYSLVLIVIFNTLYRPSIPGKKLKYVDDANSHTEWMLCIK